ncbi:unnamed protein product [Prunus brigantina]
MAQFSSSASCESNQERYSRLLAQLVRAFLYSHRLIDSLTFLFRTASVSASDDVFTWDDVVTIPA